MHVTAQHQGLAPWPGGSPPLATDTELPTALSASTVGNTGALQWSTWDLRVPRALHAPQRLLLGSFQSSLQALQHQHSPSLQLIPPSQSSGRMSLSHPKHGWKERNLQENGVSRVKPGGEQVSCSGLPSAAASCESTPGPSGDPHAQWMHTRKVDMTKTNKKKIIFFLSALPLHCLSKIDS